MPLINQRFRNNPRLQEIVNNSRTLRSGERNKTAVSLIQQALVDLSYPLPRSTLFDGTMDGDYGGETKLKIIQFQRDNQLIADGLIGRNTMYKLDQLTPSSSGDTPTLQPQPIPPQPPTPSTGKSVILTFDDGPSPVSALNSTLDTLAQNNIRAEFYLLGKEVSRNHRATKRIVDRGHIVQNHSWGHINLATASENKVRSELQRTQDEIFEATGVYPTKVRPPYGAGGWPASADRELSRVARSLSLTVENWDIDTEDWKRPAGLNQGKLTRIKRQLDNRRNHSQLNVLMHTKSSTAQDLPNFIRKLRQWGYSSAQPT